MTIPFSDMGITAQAFDAFRVEIESGAGTTPDFFLDAIQMQETGQPVQFNLSLDPDKVFYVDELRFYFTNNVALTAVTPTQMFGETLSTGINYRRQRAGATASIESGRV